MCSHTFATLDDEWDPCGGRGSAKRTHRMGKYAAILMQILQLDMYVRTYTCDRGYILYVRTCTHTTG